MFIQAKLRRRLTFNHGFKLTGFRTTRPRLSIFRATFFSQGLAQAHSSNLVLRVCLPFASMIQAKLLGFSYIEFKPRCVSKEPKYFNCVNQYSLDIKTYHRQTGLSCGLY